MKMTPSQSTQFTPLKAPDGVQMSREITLLSAVSLIVGSIIGSGIFVSPGGVLQYVGNGGSALIIWAVSGVLCTVGALCFSELGTMLPSCGGEYTYILRAFGDLPAFLTLWVNVIIIRPSAQAVVSLAFAEYSVALVFPGCKAPKVPVNLIAALALSLLTYVNMRSVRVALRVQNVFTAAKLFALAAIIAVGFYHMANGTNSVSMRPSFSVSTSDVGGVSMALYSGLFAYGGWNYVNFVTEELKDPYRNLPRSIWIALPLVTVVYVLANASYLAVLTPQEIVASNAVAVLFGRRTLGILQYSVPVFVALSTLGSLNGILFTSGRLFLAGARNGHLPPVMSFIGVKSKTPMPALLLTCSLSFGMLAFDILFLINCLMFVLWVTIAGAVGALLCLRVREPHLKRPIKVNLALPVLFLICCAFLIIFPVVMEPKSTGLAIVLTLSGIPFYLAGLFVHKSKTIGKAYDRFENCLQKILEIVPPQNSKTQ